MQKYEIVNTITVKATKDESMINILRSLRYKIFSIFWKLEMDDVKVRTVIKNHEGKIIKTFE